jgi:hypothetical protein
VALTMTAKRYLEIKRAVEARRLAATTAEVEATNWDALPHFSSVDEFLAYLEEPPKNTMPRSPRKRR